MKISLLSAILASTLITICSGCMAGSMWRYGSSYYDEYDYGPGGPQMGFGFSPGFFGYTGGYGMGTIGLLMALLMSRHPKPRPNIVHHHHHHYYKEKPGGGFDYQYKNEPPKWDYGPYGPKPSSSSGANTKGTKPGGFSSFFKNMFYRR